MADPQGFVNQVVELKGPTTISRQASHSDLPMKVMTFATISWVHRIQTASGWQRLSSDGTRSSEIASSAGSGSYCNTAAAGVNLAATTLCTGAASLVTVGYGVTMGIAAGVGAYLVVPGTKTGDSIIAAIGVGATIGSTIITIGIAGSAVICSLIGDFLGAAAGDFVMRRQPRRVPSV